MQEKIGESIYYSIDSPINESKQNLYKQVYGHSSSFISNDELQFIFNLLCIKCFRCPKVKINDDISYNLTCFCQKVKWVDFEYFLDNFPIKELKEIQDNNSNIILNENNLIERHYHRICEYHHKKFYAYCLKCKRILCNECVKEYTFHQAHQYIYFDDSNIKEKMKKIIEFIQDKDITNSIIEQNKYY